jgi:hypothetical protein
MRWGGYVSEQHASGSSTARRTSPALASPNHSPRVTKPHDWSPRERPSMARPALMSRRVCRRSGRAVSLCAESVHSGAERSTASKTIRLNKTGNRPPAPGPRRALAASMRPASDEILGRRIDWTAEPDSAPPRDARLWRQAGRTTGIGLSTCFVAGAWIICVCCSPWLRHGPPEPLTECRGRAVVECGSGAAEECSDLGD